MVCWVNLLCMSLACMLSITEVQSFTSPTPSSLLKRKPAYKINLGRSNDQIQATISKACNSDLRRTSELQMAWGNDDEISGPDRIKSCIPYMLPILDGDQFGRFIYQRIPPLDVLDQILLQPILQFYNSVPFLGLAFFLVLALGTTRNTSLSRSIRFNAQQAILIDIALIFPEILYSVTPDNLPLLIVEPATNFVYYAYISAVLYSIISNLRGVKPNQIPIISDAAEMAIGPF